jgi:hypothetical protein
MGEVGGNTEAVDLEGDSSQRVVEALLNGLKLAISHELSETLSKRISINIHTASYIKCVVGSSTVLVGLDPL